jgi:hypothetical protein
MSFDDVAGSSDGGAVLLKAVDQALGLTPALAAAFRDNRQGSKVRHTAAELLGQRIYGLALGYPDANDAGRMGSDPMMRILIDRDGVGGAALASQPTLSRFENSASNTDMYRMGTTIAEKVIAFHGTRLRCRNVKKVTIDLDPTDTPNHGEQQELSFFNGHYGHYCYLPMLGFVSFNDEPDQYLVAAVLRSGVASTRDGARGVLRRILTILRRTFRKARILVRLDGGFAAPEIFDFLDAQKVDYVVGMPGNKVLDKRAEDLMDIVRSLSERTGRGEALFGETRYAAGSWNGKERRVIYKAEIVRHPGRSARDNQRFVVTNLRHAPERVYDVYRMRGESENRIKEMQHGLRLDLTSCMSFKANQMRVLMTAAAYVLMQALRSRLAHTSLARKQVDSLRLMLLKIGAKITTSVRRIVIRMAENHPYRDEWHQAARAWGAS